MVVLFHPPLTAFRVEAAGALFFDDGWLANDERYPSLDVAFVCFFDE
jgi:hypothetical protein